MLNKRRRRRQVLPWMTCQLRIFGIKRQLLPEKSCFKEPPPWVLHLCSIYLPKSPPKARDGEYSGSITELRISVCFSGLLNNKKIQTENVTLCSISARGQTCPRSPFPCRHQLFRTAQCVGIYVKSGVLKIWLQFNACVVHDYPEKSPCPMDTQWINKKSGIKPVCVFFSYSDFHCIPQWNSTLYLSMRNCWDVHLVCF